MTLPIATYRLQLNEDFTLQDAAAIADYLRELNISHLYLSPVFSSVPGSNHGYDVTDFTVISPERGGEEGFRALADKICAYDYPMKMFIDIVPNHMAASVENPYWLDVLQKGPQSPYWSLFDIKVRKSEKIEIPVLADSAESQIKDGKISIANGKLKYYETSFPLSDQSVQHLKDNSSADIATILDMQHYTLAPWTDAFQSVSYRRFFDVMGLIGVKVEDKDVYDRAHKGIFDLLKSYSCIDGVRVDHIDGLADPETYLKRLAESTSSVWIEKILGREEGIPQNWKTAGTTGYEFIDRVNQLFVHAENFKAIEKYWIKAATPKWTDFDSCVFSSKRKVLVDLFTPELERLVCMISEDESEYKQAEIFWTGLICGLQIYRIYPGEDIATSKWIVQALCIAEDILGREFAESKAKFLPRLSDPSNHRQTLAAKEWQQLSGPVMAKGLEDTAHYRFIPLTALNEVGCLPILDAPSKQDYFDWLQKRASEWPLAMNASSTHDTKRSEDTRNRLYALADRPQAWFDFYEAAKALNAGFKTDGAPSNSMEYFIYQSILGTWPLNNQIDETYRKRIKDYMQKASREARLGTDWAKPAEKYENCIGSFIDGILNHAPFVTLAAEFAAWLSTAGAINSLSTLTLKILSPGIPDIYQGMEAWEFNLVDPDNRRNIDYAMRQELLFAADDIQEKSGLEHLLDRLSLHWRDGAIKIWLTRKLLRIREKHLAGETMPFTTTLLQTKGKYADHLVAYAITGQDSLKGLIVLLPRYPGILAITEGLAVDWADTELHMNETFASCRFYDLISDQDIPDDNVSRVSNLFSSIPISVIAFDQNS